MHGVVFDHTRALTRFGNDRQTLRVVAEAFVTTSQELLQDIKNAMLARDTRGVEKCVEPLLELSSALSARRVQSATLRLLDAVTDVDWADAHRIYALLEKRVHELMPVLQKRAIAPTRKRAQSP